MLVNGVQYRAVFWNSSIGGVEWIEQRLLPFRFETVVSRDPEDVARAIETMQVRGAPTIGAAAAYGLALAWRCEQDRFFDYWLARFRKTRPTAVNLFHACDAMEACAQSGATEATMLACAESYADREVDANLAIGETMANLLAVGERRILTHCNAGWLAAVDRGTATAGIYQLAEAGESPFVWVDETRPRMQGGRLTAWELHQAGVNCKIQADGAAAWMMAQGKVDAIVVGADRIAANGDVANKIGTYALSLAAKEHGIPMYVAAPLSTFDRATATGAEIIIEDRGSDEVLCADIVDDTSGGLISVNLMAKGVSANNPAFDVTPNENITAIVSEQGIWQKKMACK